MMPSFFTHSPAADNDTAPQAYRGPDTSVKFTGAKYDRNLSAADVSKAVRADIKAAIKSGALPAGVKCSVTSSTYSMGRSVTVKVVACPGLAINTVEFVAFEIATGGRVCFDGERRTPEAIALVKTLKQMLCAYQEDRSDIESDYHNVSFYDHVDIGWECRAADYAAIKAHLTAVAELEAVAPAASDDDALDFSIDAMRPATFTYRRHSDVVAEISREAKATGISFRTLLAGSR
jgi:hypothetical protein